MNKTDVRLPIGTVVFVAMLGFPVTPAAGPPRHVDQPTWQQAALPDGVTPEKIAQGKTLFGEVNCTVCHGPAAKGLPGMTSDLTDGDWRIVEEGAYRSLVETIMSGIGADRTGGMPMPAKGGQDITDEQVQALAAYLWSVNQSNEKREERARP